MVDNSWNPSPLSQKHSFSIYSPKGDMKTKHLLTKRQHLLWDCIKRIHVRPQNMAFWNKMSWGKNTIGLYKMLIWLLGTLQFVLETAAFKSLVISLFPAFLRLTIGVEPCEERREAGTLAQTPSLYKKQSVCKVHLTLGYMGRNGPGITVVLFLVYFSRSSKWTSLVLKEGITWSFLATFVTNAPHWMESKYLNAVQYW